MVEGAQEKGEEECCEREHHGSSPPMAGAHGGRGKGHETQQCCQDSDRVEAGSLPIATTEAQPHSELIEREREANCIDYCCQGERSSRRAREEQPGTGSREQEDAVVQVMHMCSAQMQKEIWDLSRHDQDDEHTRGNKRDEKGDEYQPGNASAEGVGGLFFVRRVHLD
jgi:hypothetical protein